jgi:hypothetical protein
LIKKADESSTFSQFNDSSALGRDPAAFATAAGAHLPCRLDLAAAIASMAQPFIAQAFHQ